jgi:hypothetical protein
MIFGEVGFGIWNAKKIRSLISFSCLHSSHQYFSLGKNFLAGSQVIVGDPLDDVVVVSSTLITGLIPSSDRFKNPANIIEQAVSVIIVDPKGRSTVGYDTFTIKVYFFPLFPIPLFFFFFFFLLC